MAYESVKPASDVLAPLGRANLQHHPCSGGCTLWVGG